jgi:hypothetical protein
LNGEALEQSCASGPPHRITHAGIAQNLMDSVRERFAIFRRDQESSLPVDDNLRISTD